MIKVMLGVNEDKRCWEGGGGGKSPLLYLIIN